ncbi:MAG: hypothetical protein KKH52_02715 [Nanoarchaeota archaeon]|nr:hypothetical protein [Nanoarchaeota archaeon]MBU1622535.1 hypothetical protein [Nanoarchaeota archaeon]MBU1974285.1 hypothetical protein [Nanoarchaeota archaeon]
MKAVDSLPDYEIAKWNERAKQESLDRLFLELRVYTHSQNPPREQAPEESTRGVTIIEYGSDDNAVTYDINDLLS